MTSRAWKTRTWIMRTLAVLLCLTLFTSWMLSQMYSKMTSGDGGNDGARLAAFVFDVEDTGNHFFDISQVDAPGKEATYPFSITNANSEVLEQYRITAEIHGSLPLTVQVKDASDTEIIELNDSTSEKITSDVIEFKSGQTELHTYTIHIVWPSEKDDLQYANAGLSEIALSISATQID